jgi:peptide deformylase
MEILDIRIYPDPILRRKAQPVEKVGEEERRILEEMAKVMYNAKGIGLAAPQIGLNKQLIVVDVGDGLLKLANPKIIEKTAAKDILEEGCLSLPQILLKVRRPKRVVVEGLNQDNQNLRIEAEGILSHAIQHEIDHLLGILIVDRINCFKRIRLRSKLRRLKKGGKFVKECLNKKTNITRCTCTYEPCSRKGFCCECIAYHWGNKQLPACFFPPEVEKTYDRSLKRFIAAYK